MSGRRFVDTNVVVYAFAPGDPKWTRAGESLAGRVVVSVQILNEFVTVSRRKLALDWPTITGRVDYLKSLVEEIVPLTTEIHDDARAIAERYKIAFYDALLIAAARAGPCNALLTEDLQHGAVIEGVTIRNPFLEAA